jgi:carbon storage regulator
MLVLTRHSGQEIIINGNIIVTVVAVDGNKVRLGIKAPKAIRVDRGEIHDRRQAEQATGAWDIAEVVANLPLTVEAAKSNVCHAHS